MKMGFHVMSFRKPVGEGCDFFLLGTFFYYSYYLLVLCSYFLKAVNIYLGL